MDTLIDAFKQIGPRHLRARVRAGRTGACGLPAAAAFPPTVTPDYTKRRDEIGGSGDSRCRWSASRRSRAKFDKAGIELMGYVMTFSDDFTDEEIDRTFLAAKTLGVKIIGTNQTRVPMGKRLAPFADKYDMVARLAQPRDGGGSQRGCLRRQLQEPVLDVEAVQGEPRHRPLRRRQQRSDRVHQAIRQGPDLASASERPQAEQRHRISRGARARRPSPTCSVCCRRRNTRSTPSSSTSTWARRRRSRK